MIDYLLALPILVSFLVSMFFIPLWIRKAHEIGLIWNDMNKFKSPKVAGSGGIVTILAFTVGVMVFVAYRTFYLESQIHLVEIFALLSATLFLAGIGLVDDLFGWQRGGLTIRSRVLLVLLSAVPLVVINVGKDVISIPFFGGVQLGLIYPLLVIPIGLLGAATTFNILAGFNGLEAGQGVIIMSALSFVAYFTGNSWLSVLALCMAGALAGFLFYNTVPARVFPGDSLTYAVGGLIAIIPIIGNFERIAIFFFIPYILEAGLKLRGKLQKYSFGKPNENGTLDLKYDKLYSLNHVGIFLLKKIGVLPTERKVVYLLWTFQLLIVVAGIFLFKQGIFIT